MRNVIVKYHIVAHAAAKHPFPAADIRALFATCGIDLHLLPGDPIESDPTHNPVTDYDSLIGDYARTDAAAGHLIIGLDDRRSRGDVAGELLDLERRGVAVVYMNSLYIRQRGMDGYLQTAAHELGHMLHLAHQDISTKFDSVMNQAQERMSSMPLAWSLADAEAQDERAGGRDPCLQMPPSPLPCYPFAHPARVLLNTNPDDFMLPWRGPYRREDDGANDLWTTGTNLRLVPDRERNLSGGPFAFTLRFRNDGKEPIRIPGEIGPEFDTLQLFVVRPDGTKYRHRPRSLACFRSEKVLKSGEEIARPFCIARGPQGAIFPEPGRYFVSAIFPGGRAASVPLELVVVKRKAGPLGDKRFRKFVAKGARGSVRMQRKLDRALSDKRAIDPTSRAYLALVRSKSTRDKSKATVLRKIALSAGSPPAVRHAAVVAELQSLRATESLSKASLRNLIDRHLTRDDDRYLAEQLEEFYR